MCGIAGALGLPTDRAVAAAQAMRSALRRRGPDDEGIETIAPPGGGPAVVLAHRRLSIFDLSPAGHQPMADAPTNGQPRNWIVFNGEIFNFPDLHAELAADGWPCRTRCDTEVILHAYRVWGERAVDRFRGMFAWCLLDSTRQVAWFCRDRLGIKPLYLYRPTGGGLLFASEVRALLASGLVPPRLSTTAVESFLAQGAVYEPDTIVDGVRMLAPGESLVTDWAGNEIRKTTYWRIPFAADDAADGDRPAAIDRLHETLRDAIRMRLTGDVPVGLFLSGGVDSAAVATVATEVGTSQVRTISIGFDQPEFDETDAAQRVARELKTDHRTLRLTGAEIVEHLGDVLAAVDQPTVDGFNTFFVSREARRAGLTVALSGVGGDELFGGYASFRDIPRALRLRRRLAAVGWAARPAARALSGLLGRGTAKAATLLERPASALQAYFLRRELFLPRDRRSLSPAPPGSDPFAGTPKPSFAAMALASADLDLFNQVSSFEVSGYLRNMLLRDADVFSMAHGLEVRVPLLDHRFVEIAAAMPGRWKHDPKRTKSALLDAVGPRLPKQVATMPKRGFTFPWDAWLRGPVRPLAIRSLENADIWCQAGLNPDAPRRLWDRFERGDRSVSSLQVLALTVLGDFVGRHGLRWTA